MCIRDRLTPIYRKVFSILGSPEKSKSQSIDVEFLYAILILRPLSSETVPRILPDIQTDSLILSAYGIKYRRSLVLNSDLSSLISNLTFSVKFLNAFAESAIIANFGIFKMLLSQLI